MTVDEMTDVLEDVLHASDAEAIDVVTTGGFPNELEIETPDGLRFLVTVTAIR